MIENFEKLTGYFSFVSLKQVDITPYVDLIPKGVGFMFCGIVLYLFLSISKNKASVFVSQRRAKNRYMELAVVNKSGIVLDLEELSQLWVDDRKKQLYSKLANNDALDIEDMSFIWRTPLQAEDKSFIPTFKYGRSQAFFEEYIQSSIAFETGPVHRSACIRLIQTIEEYGDYPSVVNIYDKNKTLKANRKVTDHDVTLDESTFSLLANVSLLDHSIDVCEKAFELLKDREAVHVAPDCFIACLGHDLGKLPPAHSTFYSMHDHASCASKLLSRIEELNLLPRINEIFSAIKCHHKSVKGLLAEVLQEADQRARADEVECVASGVYEYAQVICDSPVYVDPRVEKSGLKPAASITEQILIEAQNQSNTIEKGDSTSAPKEGMATVIPMSEQTSKSDSSQQKEKDTGAEEKKIEKVSKVKPEDRQTKEGNTGKDEGETIVFKNEKKRRRSGKKKQGEVKSEETKNQQTIRIEPDTDKTKTETQAKNNEEVKSIDLEEVVPLVAQKKQGTTQELPPQDQTQPCNAGHEVDAGYVEALMSGPHEPITDYGEPEVIIEGKTVSNEQQGQICLDVEIEEQIVSSKASPQELEPAQKKEEPEPEPKEVTASTRTEDCSGAISTAPTNNSSVFLSKQVTKQINSNDPASRAGLCMPKLYQQQQRVSQEQPQTAATCTEPSSVQDIVGNILPPQPEQITEQPVVKTTTQTVDVKEKPTKKAALMRAALTTKFDSSSDEPTSSGEITTARTYQDIDGWFDPDNYLEEIKSRINDVDKKGVLALSMPDGHVYVSKAIQMMIVEKQMDTAGFRESEKSADPKQYMLNCLIAITRYFLEERQGTIDAKMIAAGFWGNKFLITKASTSPTGQRMYTPYHSDTFGPLAEMEKRKQPNTKIIKSVDLNINTIPVTSV